MTSGNTSLRLIWAIKERAVAYVTRLKVNEELLVAGVFVVSLQPGSRGASHLHLQIEAPDGVSIEKRKVAPKNQHVDDC